MTEDQITAWLEPAVDQWFRRQVRNLCTPFWMYVRVPEGDHPGELVIEPDPPNEHFRQVLRISPAWSKRTAMQKCMERARMLPLFGGNS